MDRWDRACGFRFGLLYPRVAYSPLGGRGQSAWRWPTWCSSCSSCVIERFRFDLFHQVFLVAECLADSSRGVHRQSAWPVLSRTVRSVSTDGLNFGGAVLEIRGLFSDGSPCALRTVRLSLTDGPPGARGQSVWCLAKLLSPLLLELCFRVALSWDLFLGLVGPLWLRNLDKLVWELWI
jgi:hypothetical protein